MRKRKFDGMCSICGKPIAIKGTWKYGNNAEPINDGRCCDQCDLNVVIPARLARLNNLLVQLQRSGK